MQPLWKNNGADNVSKKELKCSMESFSNMPKSFIKELQVPICTS
jgi:hypothetical protein